MTEVGNVYGESLYSLAKEESITAEVGQQLAALRTSFRQEPEFIRLLSSPNLTKAERCQILDDSFRGKVHPYVLNFLKILTEKGYMRSFDDCCEAFTDHYDQDNGIVRVTAVTAVALTSEQSARITEKLNRITGRQVILRNRVDPAVLGGVRLDYDGQRLDDTVSHHLDAVREMLSKTVL
ncbi:MAG: ATP synthase F1 subunit delta [Faecousia sp.]